MISSNVVGKMQYLVNDCIMLSTQSLISIENTHSFIVLYFVVAIYRTVVGFTGREFRKNNSRRKVFNVHRSHCLTFEGVSKFSWKNVAPEINPVK